jgi:hypothetical protein
MIAFLLDKPQHLAGIDHFDGVFFQTVPLAQGGNATDRHAADEGTAEVEGHSIRLPVAKRSENALGRSHNSWQSIRSCASVVNRKVSFS